MTAIDEHEIQALPKRIPDKGRVLTVDLTRFRYFEALERLIATAPEPGGTL